MIPQYFFDIIAGLAIVAMAGLTVLELRRDLMMLQQNSYRLRRYRRWLKSSADTTSGIRLTSYMLILLCLSSFRLGNIGMIAVTFLGIYGLVKLLRARYKKPLAMTRRATRLFAVQLVLVAVVTLAAVLFFGRLGAFSLHDSLYSAALAVLICYSASHIITMAALCVLMPVERHINRKFYNAAAAKLAQMPDLKIVGITGSYGKTSTKHYLNRILSEHFDTLITPGSFNTTLGVVRTINELLKPYNEVFIVEMGAKQRGDIAEICDLVHPQTGIITAVGPQHLETFGSIDNVCDTKFELADALPSDGLAVINNDFAPIAARKVDNVPVVRYGIADSDACAYTARDIVYTPQGTDFTVVGEGNELRLHTQLVGECNISNLVAAVAVARHLGVPDDKIKYAVGCIEQVEHRLSIRQTPTLTIIDDAFNSNPVGSKMALDVLAMMSGTRFVITPGMVELGAEQYALNEQLGRNIARCADIAIIVNRYNHDAIVKGIEEGGMSADRVFSASNFNEAYAMMMQMHKAGDTVLIENDLPDTFK